MNTSKKLRKLITKMWTITDDSASLLVERMKDEKCKETVEQVM